MNRFQWSQEATVNEGEECGYGKPWTKEETCKFIQGLGRYRGDWQKISDYVGTKSVIDVFHYWSYCFQGLNEQLKEQFYENILHEDRKISLDSQQQQDNMSFFAQKIAPLLDCGYDGLFSLVAGFSQLSRVQSHQKENPVEEAMN